MHAVKLKSSLRSAVKQTWLTVAPADMVWESNRAFDSPILIAQKEVKWNPTSTFKNFASYRFWFSKCLDILEDKKDIS